MKTKKWLWILDRWETLDHPQDTSLRLIQAALQQKIECWVCTPFDLSLSNSGLAIQAQKVLNMGQLRTQSEIQLSPGQSRQLSDFSMVHYRVDPPVDLAYLQPLQILRFESARLKAKKRPIPAFVHPIDVLLSENEKTAGMYLKRSPRTLVSSKIDQIVSFIRKLKGKAIIKPMHMAQSRDIHAVALRDDYELTPADHEHILRMTENGTRPIVTQQFLKKIYEGETRLWFCDSKLIAAARKVPHQNSFRIDMDHGSTLQAHSLTSIEKKAASDVAKLLKIQKIRLAAVDLIDSQVTDYNFTSPGLLVGLEKLSKCDLATQIILSLKKS